MFFFFAKRVKSVSESKHEENFTFFLLVKYDKVWKTFSKHKQNLTLEYFFNRILTVIKIDYKRGGEAKMLF